MTMRSHQQQSSWSCELTLDGASPRTSCRRALLEIKRFDGIRKLRRSWDSLRRDDELWLKEGNCLIHLYAPDTSRRGPSLKIPLDTVEQSGCPYLFGEREYRPDPPSPSASSEDDNSDSGYGASISDKAPPSRTCGLYIPAPVELTRHEAYLYHIGTRNYFAYLLNKPIVGEHLGSALSDLAARIEEWQPESVETTSFLDYCKEQGYLDFAENIDYTVAALVLADQARIASIWVDAFAHCVGMRQRLERASEAVRLSDTTKALINHASSELNSHISRATIAIGTFLEEELGPDHLGLSKPMRDHLDRFRSMLHSFYVHQVGYFPPAEEEPWDKRLWNELYDDFQALYEYLADTESSTDRVSVRGLNGGICVTQNLAAFDERHGYIPLPHPLPLEPEMPVQRRGSELQRSLRSFKLGRLSDAILQPEMTQTLLRASNHSNPAIVRNRLVQEYAHFERFKLEEKVSVVEARKVRWLLVYGVLQTLISIIRAPAEVQDTETPSYPLCLVETGRPSWMLAEMGHQDEDEPQTRISTEMDAVRRTMEEDRFSIRPDCEADCAEDYFSMNRVSRRGSCMSAGAEELPTRPSPLISRTASIRSSVNSLHRSIVGSLSRHGNYSIRRKDGSKLPSRMSSFCEEMPGPDSPQEVDHMESGQDRLDLCDDISSGCRSAESEAAREDAFVPTLELHQLSIATVRSADANNRVESPSTESGYFSQATNSGSSSYFDEPNSPTSVYSTSTVDCALEGAGRTDSAMESCTRDRQACTIREKPETYRPKTITDVAQPVGMTDGCYFSSRPDSAAHPRMQSRAMSAESVCSMVSSASSQYPECSQQAAEIEEEETRGRQRLRGLHKIRAFGDVDGEMGAQDTPFPSADERC